MALMYFWGALNPKPVSPDYVAGWTEDEFSVGSTSLLLPGSSLSLMFRL